MHRSDITTRLESMGVRFAEGHDARNVGEAGGADLFVRGRRPRIPKWRRATPRA
jgi:hypothetical protein